MGMFLGMQGWAGLLGESALCSTDLLALGAAPDSHQCAGILREV